MSVSSVNLGGAGRGGGGALCFLLDARTCKYVVDAPRVNMVSSVRGCCAGAHHGHQHDRGLFVKCQIWVCVAVLGLWVSYGCRVVKFHLAVTVLSLYTPHLIFFFNV